MKPRLEFLKSSFSLCIVLSILSISGIKAQENRKCAVIAYYMDMEKEVDNYPVEKLTHIIYSFLHLDGNNLRDHGHDSASISHLVSLRERNPELKVILSLGGWGGCPTCPEVFSTEKGRTEFALSVKGLLEKYGADGLDLDWEYPAIESVPGYAYSPADKPNFTLLMKSLRETLGQNYELSFAAGGFREFLANSIEWDKVMPYLNYVNLMTYDYINGYSTRTGHHTPLYSTPEQPGSTDFAVRFLDSIGVPRNKIVIGAAFYGRIFKNVGNTNNGLYQSCVFTEYVNYKNFESYFAEGSGFADFWDPIAQASYSYNKEKQLFATYDDKRSVDLKTRYVLEHQLGGIMFWSLSSDSYRDGLLDVIDKVRKETR